MSKPLPACLALLVVTLTAAATEGTTTISQRDRTFDPGTVTLGAGEGLRILNDDRFVHNIRSNTEGFAFDSKVQRPGDGIHVYFRERGYYELGCAIHPKMTLAVTVE